MQDQLRLLSDKRRKWVEANIENGFEEGIKRLLTELYPDNAHFIYELLQNAEDTEATEVTFTLGADSIDFEHNGKRPFSYKDVDSITSIGVSTKRDDPTSIGKFGVGFKAVFAYTNSPEIQSGNVHFRIRDLVVPETLESAGKNKSPHQLTIFKFPFNHPTKKAEQAVIEIEKGLRGLEDNTLLFLRHIRKISYLLPDGSLGLIERIDHLGRRIEIKANHPNNTESTSNWLRFQDDVEVIDETGTPKLCRVAIAYSIVEEQEQSKTKQNLWKIVPLEHGQVSIFFPAEKETSNLRFHLHAPFASTVARDSVRNCSSNDILRDHLAQLIVKSLPVIRDEGKLTVGFLSVLPNPADNLPKFYCPIQEAVVEAFQEEELMPAKEGGHAPVSCLYTGPAAISEVIKDKDLSILTGVAPPLWAVNAPPQAKRELAFIDSLEIDEWGWDKLIEKITTSDDEEKKRIEDWIVEKSDNWLLRFYALLGEASEYGGLSPNSDLNLIRVLHEDTVEHVGVSEAFLPPTDAIELPSDVRLVKLETYNAGRSDAQKASARKFLESAGVRVFDTREVVKRKLEKYNKRPARYLKNQYIQDIQLFIEYSKSDAGILVWYKKYPFLRGVTADGEEQWCKPQELYLDRPYRDTGLQNLFEDQTISLEKRKIRLSEQYQSLSMFSDFVVALGVMDMLEIVKHKATEMQKKDFIKNGRNTENTIDMDFFLNHLESPGYGWHWKSSKFYLGPISLARQNIHISCAVWQTMCRAQPEQLIAHYMPNSQKRYAEKRGQSLLIKQLRSCSWIPDKNGVFKKPADITKEELHQAFQYDDRNGWLTAIGLGENIRKQSEEYQARNIQARDLGFKSADELAEAVGLLKETGLTPSELREIAAERKKIDQPESPVINPDRRRRKVIEGQEDASFVEKIKRERTVQPGLAADKQAAKAYLRDLYTNSEGEMGCQCCRYEMPFKHKNSELHYFEAVQLLRKLDKRYKEVNIALCPTCSAMYRHAKETDDAEVQNEFISQTNQSPDASIEVPVFFSGRQYNIRFAPKHWFDLKTILEKS